MRKSVALDVDGVIAQYDGWKGVDVIGSPIPGAVEFVATIAEYYDVIIHYIDDKGIYCNPQKDSDAFMATLQVLGIKVSE